MALATGVVLPSTVLEYLKCVHCSLYLTVPPVMYNYGQALVCGRCKNEGNLLIRATAFETVAKLLRFPCRYVANGCSKTQLTWEAVEEHEVTCDYRPILCPSLDNCEWKGSSKMILDHFKEEHELLMYLGGFPIEFEITIQETKLIDCLGQIFLLELGIDVEEGKIRFIATHIASQQGEKADNISYTSTLDLKSSDNSNIVKFSHKVKPKYQRNFDKSGSLEISIASIKNVLNTPAAFCRIFIFDNAKPNKKAKKKTVEVKDENQIGTSTTSASEVSPKIDKLLLNELECPICKEYMISPIFVCKNGHSICGDCKEKLGASCPSCRIPFGNTRNFVLEKLTSCIDYPCRNESSGCNFVGNSNTISEHNKTCTVRFNDCPLKEYEHCTWRGLFKNTSSHIKSKHASNYCMTVNAVVYRKLNRLILSSCIIMSYEEQLFKICCKHSLYVQGPVTWAFQHVGLGVTDVSPYKFEIEFLDQTNSGRKFIINAPCQSDEDKDVFGNGLVVSYALLRPFITTDNFLIFKYDIQRYI